MLTRRAFIQATAAGAAALVQVPPLRAATYDLVVAGGRVIDPSQNIDRIADVAVTGGRIVAITPNIPPAEATAVIDARGRLVTPGLVDIHAHVADEMPPAACLKDGVTALVDAGSRGADNVGPLVEVVRSSPNRARILLNLSRKGLGGPGELLDFTNADAAAARRVIEANRDLIVGIKARLSENVARTHDLDAVRRAHEVTVPLNIPLMVHVGQTVSPLSSILQLLRPGDIVTHVYAPPPNGIFDVQGRMFPEVLDARRRGIVFDIGNGRNGHITWDVADRAIQQGFLPDTISCDLTAAGRTDRAFDLPTVLSKFLMLGMPLNRVVACATVNAARAMAPFKDLGTLRTGAPADIAVFELRQGDFEFVDNVNAKRNGPQKLFPTAVVVGGKRTV